MRMIFFLMLVSVSAWGEAGAGSSGGGGAFVCRDANGDITEVELADLWEARALDGLNIAVSAAEPAQQALAAIDKLAPHDAELHKRTRANLRLVLRQVQQVPARVGIARPADMFGGYMKPNCPLEGLMFYDGARGRLAVNQDLFSRLPNNTEVAALYVHEALYKTMREFYRPQTTSETTRRFVGCLFSDMAKCFRRPVALSRLFATVSGVKQCIGPTLDYYLWNAGGKTHIIVKRIGNSEYAHGLAASAPETQWPKRFRLVGRGWSNMYALPYPVMEDGTGIVNLSGVHDLFERPEHRGGVRCEGI